MTELDSTDVEIVQLLLEDARRSYREIAEEVGLSPPSVSNRIERLQDLGIVRRFTLELDQTQLTGYKETLLILETHPSETEAIASQLTDTEGVEHVFRTIESRIVAKAVLSPTEVHALFAEDLSKDAVEDYQVETVLNSSWHPQFREGNFEIECTICGNTISDEGETVEVNSGNVHRVCCSMCAEEVVEQYEALQEGVEG